MSLPFLHTAPGYDEDLRDSVLFERGLHATPICGRGRRRGDRGDAAGAGRGGDRLRRRHPGQHGRRPGGGQPHRGGTVKPGPLRLGRARRRGSGRPGPARAHRPADRAGGRCGFLQPFCGDRAQPDAVVRGLGTDWELPRVASSRTRAATSPTGAWTPPCGCAQGLAVRSHPEERAAELATRTLAFLTPERRGSHRAGDLGGER